MSKIGFIPINGAASLITTSLFSHFLILKPWNPKFTFSPYKTILCVSEDWNPGLEVESVLDSVPPVEIQVGEPFCSWSFGGICFSRASSENKKKILKLRSKKFTFWKY